MADIFDLFKQIAKKDDIPRAPVTWLIVGLGNPGEKYRLTRHNAGFLTLDSIAQKAGARLDRAKYQALCGEAVIGSHRVLLMKPQTMMNASGIAVQEAVAFYKIEPDHILVISDDIAQEPGKMRLRKKGSAGGQNGLKDIITCLGTDACPRLRMGVGAKPHPDYDLADWVLGDIPPNEWQTFEESLLRARDAIDLILQGKIDVAMNQYN